MSIADKITRLQTAKSGIASAISAKGGTVGASDGFEEFASDIASIPSGGGSGTVIEGTITPSSDADTVSVVLSQLIGRNLTDIESFTCWADLADIAEEERKNLLLCEGGTLPKFTSDDEYATFQYILGKTVNWIFPYFFCKFFDASGVIYNKGDTNARAGGIGWNHAHFDLTNGTFVFGTMSSSIFFKAGITYHYLVRLRS